MTLLLRLAIALFQVIDGAGSPTTAQSSAEGAAEDAASEPRTRAAVEAPRTADDAAQVATLREFVVPADNAPPVTMVSGDDPFWGIDYLMTIRRGDERIYFQFDQYLWYAPLAEIGHGPFQLVQANATRLPPPRIVANERGPSVFAFDLNQPAGVANVRPWLPALGAHKSVSAMLAGGSWAQTGGVVDGEVGDGRWGAIRIGASHGQGRSWREFKRNEHTAANVAAVVLPHQNERFATRLQLTGDYLRMNNNDQGAVAFRGDNAGLNVSDAPLTGRFPTTTDGQFVVDADGERVLHPALPISWAQDLAGPDQRNTNEVIGYALAATQDIGRSFRLRLGFSQQIDKQGNLQPHKPFEYGVPICSPAECAEFVTSEATLGNETGQEAVWHNWYDIDRERRVMQMRLGAEYNLVPRIARPWLHHADFFAGLSYLQDRFYTSEKREVLAGTVDYPLERYIPLTAISADTLARPPELSQMAEFKEVFFSDNRQRAVANHAALSWWALDKKLNFIAGVKYLQWLSRVRNLQSKTAYANAQTGQLTGPDAPKSEWRESLDTRLLKNVGVTTGPWGPLSVFYHYSEGFLPTVGLRDPKGIDIAAASSVGHETGLRLSLPGGIRLAATVFQNEYSGVPEQMGPMAQGLLKPRTVPATSSGPWTRTGQRVRGFAVEGTARWEGLMVTGKYIHADAVRSREDSDADELKEAQRAAYLPEDELQATLPAGRPLNGSRRHYLDIHGRYEILRGVAAGLYLRLSVQHRGRMVAGYYNADPMTSRFGFTDTKLEFPSYTLLGAGLGYRTKLAGLGVTAEVNGDNLGNSVYMIGAREARFVYRGDLRRVFGILRVSY